MQKGRPQLPRYLFCLSNWLIMDYAKDSDLYTGLLSKSVNVPPIQATGGTNNCLVAAIFDELEPSTQPVHAVEVADWERKDFRIYLYTVSSVRFLSPIFVHYPSVDRQLLTHKGTAILQSLMRKIAQSRSPALRCACSTLPSEWSHHFVPLSHHCLSDPLDLSHSVLDHARTGLTDSSSIHKQATIASDANVAHQLSSFRTTEEHVPGHSGLTSYGKHRNRHTCYC